MTTQPLLNSYDNSTAPHQQTYDSSNSFPDPLHRLDKTKHATTDSSGSDSVTPEGLRTHESATAPAAPAASLTGRVQLLPPPILNNGAGDAADPENPAAVVPTGHHSLNSTGGEDFAPAAAVARQNAHDRDCCAIIRDIAIIAVSLLTGCMIGGLAVDRDIAIFLGGIGGVTVGLVFILYLRCRYRCCRNA